MKRFDIVMVAVQGWDFEIGSNARNIALEFARHHRVLYVNPPLDWASRIRTGKNERTKKYIAVAEGNESGLVQVQENLWNLYPDFIASSINWVAVSRLHDLLNWRTNSRFAKCIGKAVQQLGFDSFVLFNDNLIFRGLYLKELLKPQKYIYYIRDYLVVQPYFKKHGVRLEPQLMEKADAVVANSPYLKEYAAAFNSKSYYVGQGCEVDMFDEDLVSDIPEDIRSIRGPLIGYVGFLTSMRLDIELLVTLAAANPEWNIVLVGPEDDAFRQSPLHRQKNVFFPGKKSPAELPSYIKAFQVCINPQVVNQLTIGNYPRKVDEYLAMGKPTVATKTKAMEIFKDYTHLASSTEEFIQLVEVALKDHDLNSKRERKAFAKSHTWENSVNEIYMAIESLEP
jgi:teichuronic acid biosynthesis glycosyltransferase TuaH